MKGKAVFYSRVLITTGLILALLVSANVSWCYNEIESTSIRIDLMDIKLQTMTADVRLYIKITGFLNQSNIPIIIRNQLYDRDTHDFIISEDHTFSLKKTDEQIVNNITKTTYENTTEHQFRLFGLKHVYPYDSYLLNFTIQFYTNAQMANETTTLTVYTWPEEWQAPQFPESPIKTKYFLKEIITQIPIDRTKGPIGFENFYVSLILIIGFSYLIDPHIEKIALYVAVMLQIAQLINIYTVDAPPKAGTTYIHLLIYSLLFFTTLFAILDILGLHVEQCKKNNKAIPNLINGFYESIYYAAPLANVALFSSVFILIKMEYEKYWWIKLPNDIVLYVMISFMLPYLIKQRTIVIVTIKFIKNIIQNVKKMIKQKHTENDCAYTS